MLKAQPDPIAIRLPPELLKRVDSLAKVLKKHPDHSLHRVSRSFVLRLAVQQGVELLEKKHKG